MFKWESSGLGQSHQEYSLPQGRKPISLYRLLLGSKRAVPLHGLWLPIQSRQQLPPR